MDRFALTLIIIGGLNWGLVGLFGFDLVAWACGGSSALVSRLIYIVIALAACWGISMLFKKNSLAESA